MRERRFEDRVDAGRRLADLLAHLRDEDVVVLGLPRGGVPVAAPVAERLEAPLDVIVVRKLGLPGQPELAMGAIGEGDVRVLNSRLISAAHVRPGRVARVETTERAELERRVNRFRSGSDPVDITGKTVVIVDDGIATGSTARAACDVTRARGAARVVLAVPVAPPGWVDELGDTADEYVTLATPERFRSVGTWYVDFSQTTDEEVMACLSRASGHGR